MSKKITNTEKSMITTTEVKENLKQTKKNSTMSVNQETVVNKTEKLKENKNENNERKYSTKNNHIIEKNKISSYNQSNYDNYSLNLFPKTSFAKEIENTIKDIKSNKLQKIRLSENEIIERKDIISTNNNLPYQNINTNSNFDIYYKEVPKVYYEIIYSKIIQNQNLQEEIINTVGVELELINEDIKQDICNNILAVSDFPKNTNNVLNKSIEKSIDHDQRNKQDLLKELDINEKNLIGKISALDEEQKMLEKKENLIKLNASFSLLNNSNNYNNKHQHINNVSINDYSNINYNNSNALNGKDLIDHNIRQSRLKEIKRIKETLDNKLSSVKQQAQRIIDEEENFNYENFNASNIAQANRIKKAQEGKDRIKNYLLNFETTKEAVAKMVNNWEKDYKNKMLSIEKAKEKVKELVKADKLDHKKKQIELIEKVKERRNEENKAKKERNNREESIVKNIDYPKGYIGVKVDQNKNLLYLKMKENYDNKVKEEQEKVYNEKLKNDLKRKALLKPLDKSEFYSFAKKYEEDKEKRKYEKEKARLIRMEEIITVNATLPKFETEFYKRILCEEQERKEKMENEKAERSKPAMRIHIYSETIKNDFNPKIDLNKREEIEERKLELCNIKDKRNYIKCRSNIKKHIHNKFGKYSNKITYKANPNKINLKSHENNLEKQTEDANKNNEADFINSYICNKEEELKKSQSADGKRNNKSKHNYAKKPLEKRPDYLSELRRKHESEGIELN